ncbi:MAG: hypothetical protein ACRCSN_09540, partial [Dermatophilaceae bacterium]
MRLLADDPSDDAEKAVAATRITHAYAALSLEGRDAALAELLEARAVAQRLGSHRLTALCDVQEGAVRIWCGEWAEAAAALGRVPLQRSVLTDAEIATTLLNRGLVHTSMLDLPRARRALRRALDVATRCDLPIQRFKSLHNMGCLEWMAGDLPAAIRLMEEADRIPVSVDRARARLDRARVLADAGLIDQAEDALRTALDASASARMLIDRGDVHLDLALCALLRDDLAEAREQAQRAARAFSARQAWSRRDEARLVQVAVDVRSGSSVAALSRALKALTSTGRPGDTASRMATRLDAELALRRRDISGARSALDRLAHGPRQPVGIVLHERSLRARTLVGEGRVAAARRVLRESADLLIRHQGDNSSLDVRAALALHGRTIRDVDVGLALETGDPPRLFDAVERWRAASQRARLAVPDRDDTLTSLIARLRRTRYLIDIGEVPDDDPLRTEERALQRSVAERTWIRHRARDEAPGSRQAATVATVAEIAAGLAVTNGAVLLSFFTFGGHLYVVGLGTRGCRLLTLGPAQDIERLAGELLADLRATVRAPSGHALASVVEAAYSDSLDRMGEALRVADLVEKADRVVVIPAASTASLPWSALPGLRGRPVTVVPSATRWYRRSHHSAAVGDIVAIAGPGL